MPLSPVALFNLRVDPGEVLIPAGDFPATIRVTMAAIDPTEEPETDSNGNLPSVPRSTLKLFKQPMGDVDESEDGDDDDFIKQLLAEAGNDDEDSEDDEEEEESNGGPSDPAKSKQARQAAALKKLIQSASGDDSDDDMDDATGKLNGKKGKAPAMDDDDEEEEEDDDESDVEGLDLEHTVLCTLDTERTYQQPLEITIGEREKAFFMVSGTHAIHLSGNYLIDEATASDGEDDEDSEDEYDLSPNEDELDEDDYSSDELDGVDGTDRVEEVDTDEEVPDLVDTKASKGKNKRAADEAESLDALIAQDGQGETKLSKKQQKKLKNNKGEPVGQEETKSSIKETPGKSDKKVQFAKNLEQGPTGSAEKAKAVGKKPEASVKVVQGVTIDDRKVGTGRAAKSGDMVGMRYIGKLQSGKVFDSNKKGKPFSFKLGKGEVIKGWDVGVAGMAVGGERRLTIPANLAYGKRGAPPDIPGNSTLVFDVKLLEIK